MSIGPSHEEILGIKYRRCGRGPGPLEHGYRIQELEARVRELEAQLAMAEAAAGEAGKLVARFRSQRDELRKALRFYADEGNYDGNIARAALLPAPTDEDKP